MQAEPGQPGRARRAGGSGRGARPPRPGGRWSPSSPCRGSGTARWADPRAAGGSGGRRAGRTASRPAPAAGSTSPRRSVAAATSPIAHAPGRPGHAQVRRRPSTRPPRPCGRSRAAASGLACTPAAQTSVWHGSTSPSARVTASPADGRDLGAEPHLDAARAQRLERVAAARRRERVQQVVLHLDQHDPGPADVEARVVLAEHHGEQLGQRAGGLDAGRPAADHHEGEPAAVELASGRGRPPRSARSTWFRSRVASSSV